MLRVRRARNRTALMIGIGMLVLAPILSWWLAPIFFAQAAYLATLDRRMARSEVPEVVAAGGMLTTGASMVAAIAVTGGAESPLLPLLIAPVAFIAARFRPRVVAAGIAIGAAAAIGTGLAVDAGALIDDPALTLVTVILIAAVGAISAALQEAEVQHRRESVLDPLTGLLNRKALQTRFDEIEEQARITGGRVCLIELDLDHFKRINDTLGHSRGDAVLRDVAYTLRKRARTFELIYRIGGEEFLVVVPGADLGHGLEIAERLHKAVGEARPGGVPITISCGVAAAEGDSVRFEPLFAAVDEALYEAKLEGRDRVSAADGRSRRLDSVPA